DFTAAEGEGNVMQETLLGEPPNFEHGLADRRHFLFKQVTNIASDHQCDHFKPVSFSHGLSRDVTAVPKHRHAFAQPEDLLDAVRDVNDSDPSFSEFTYHLKQKRCFALSQ